MGGDGDGHRYSGSRHGRGDDHHHFGGRDRSLLGGSYSTQVVLSLATARLILDGLPDDVQ
jgi:hypothetical protein